MLAGWGFKQCGPATYRTAIYTTRCAPQTFQSLMCQSYRARRPILASWKALSSFKNCLHRHRSSQVNLLVPSAKLGVTGVPDILHT